MPQVSIKNMVPNSRIRNEAPNVKASAFQTGRTGDEATAIKAGMPIGLLLVLTYAAAVASSQPSFGDFRSNVSIRNLI